MAANSTNPLLMQLRDVHPPAEISWWPPAIGWWIVLLLSYLLLVFLIKNIRSYLRARRYRRSALSELGHQYTQWQTEQDVAAYFASANQILRRVLNHLPQGKQYTANTGQDLADSLNLYVEIPLDHITVIALTQSAYQAEPQGDIDAIHSDLERWLKTHKRKLPTPADKAEPQNA